MRSEAQRQASRKNGAKSKGPKTEAGKNRSKMNSLRHGLRSEQVVLPGEDAAEFDAELEGWRDDWRPRTHTQAVLCERAAAASWRMRRCVRAEADLLLDLAGRRAARRRDLDGPGAEVDRRVRRGADAAERADDLAEYLVAEPARTVADLRAFPEGLDRLAEAWGGLLAELGRGARSWRYGSRHEMLMALLGRDPESDPIPAGPLAVDSYRLVQANDPGFGDDDDEPVELSDAEADELAGRIRAGVERHREALLARRAALAAAPADAPAAGPAAGGDGAPEEDLKFVAVSRRVLLLHRYEMAHERSMRSAMRDLMALERAGFGAGRGANRSSEVIEVKRVEVKESGPASRPATSAGGSEAGPSSAPSEPDRRGSRGARDQPRRDRKGRTWPVERGAGGGSSS